MFQRKDKKSGCSVNNLPQQNWLTEMALHVVHVVLYWHLLCDHCFLCDFYLPCTYMLLFFITCSSDWIVEAIIPLEMWARLAGAGVAAHMKSRASWVVSSLYGGRSHYYTRVSDDQPGSQKTYLLEIPDQIQSYIFSSLYSSMFCLSRSIPTNTMAQRNKGILCKGFKPCPVAVRRSLHTVPLNNFDSILLGV